MTKRQADELTNNILEIIDLSDDGVSIPDIVLYGINFRALMIVINILWRYKLITIDANHVARRART